MDHPDFILGNFMENFIVPKRLMSFWNATLTSILNVGTYR